MNQITAINHQSLSGIAVSVPQGIDEKSCMEAKEYLDRLLNLSSIPLSMKTVCKTLSIVNVQVVNPYGEKDFSLRVKATYGTFQNYPDCVFNEKTAYRLSTISKFFPSANEIKQVLDEEKQKLDIEIANLKSIIRNGYTSKKDRDNAFLKLSQNDQAIVRSFEKEPYRSDWYITYLKNHVPSAYRYLTLKGLIQNRSEVA